MTCICPDCHADFGQDSYAYRQHLTGKFPCKPPETEAQRDKRVAAQIASAAEDVPAFSAYERDTFNKMVRTGSTPEEAARVVAGLAKGRERAIAKARAAANAIPAAPAAVEDDAETIDELLEQRGTGSIGAEAVLTEEE